MNQTITSAATSIRQVPALHRRIGHMPREWIVVDLGCGAYDDGMAYLRALGLDVAGLDPYNRTPEENARGDALLRTGMANAVLCANVLNVIREPEARAAVITQASKADIGFFTVYEGDATGEGRVTPKGWQEHRRTRDYLAEVGQGFAYVAIKRRVIVGAHTPFDLVSGLASIA